ncbi:unnamed protein product [Ectocarpus sp. CCAP 1310/34]|nr:unnamed protein product [Ectocarpus sp. CCAP 1310/34]
MQEESSCVVGDHAVDQDAPNW